MEDEDSRGWQPSWCERASLLRCQSNNFGGWGVTLIRQVNHSFFAHGGGSYHHGARGSHRPPSVRFGRAPCQQSPWITTADPALQTQCTCAHSHPRGSQLSLVVITLRIAALHEMSSLIQS